jgi:hypothetical protein
LFAASSLAAQFPLFSSAPASPDMPTAVGAQSMTEGDFSHDGKLDVATADKFNGTVSVYLGNGDGTFEAPLVFAVGSNPLGIVAADFNGDGKLDLATALSSTDNIAVLLGNGNGTFKPLPLNKISPPPIPTRIIPFDLIAGDFNGNGKLDLITSDGGRDDVAFLPGLGNGTFGPAIYYPLGKSPLTSAPDTPTGLVTDDFNGDGHLDFAVTDPVREAVWLFLGNGNGTFQTPINVTGNGFQFGRLNPSQLVAADFNGDGKPDLAVTDAFSNNLAVYLGNGNGTFAAPTVLATDPRPFGLAADDFNGDGKIDLAVGNQNTDSVTVFLGAGNGAFPAWGTFQAGTTPFAIVTGRFTANGQVDIVTGNNNGPALTLLVRSGTGAAPPLHITPLPGGKGPQSIVSADFNQDRIVDLATANTFSDSLSIFFGVGDGTFGSPINIVVGTHGAQIVAVGDFNGDGIPDLVTAGGDNYLSVLLGNGNGTFTDTNAYAIGGDGAHVLYVDDLNNDGKLDVAVTSAYSNTVSIFLGNGNGTFRGPRIFPVGGPSDGLVGGRFTSSGQVDLLVTNVVRIAATGPMMNGQTIAFLRGNGDGTFSPFVGVGTGGSVPGNAVVGDFNGDGRLDLVVSNRSGNTVSLYLGNGNGTFQAPQALQVGVTPAALVTGDFNGDGKLDLAVDNNFDQNVAFLFGNGNGTFEAAIFVPVGVKPRALTAADFDHDGSTDLAVGNFGANSVSLILFDRGGVLRSTVLSLRPVTARPLLFLREPEARSQAKDRNGGGSKEISDISSIQSTLDSTSHDPGSVAVAPAETFTVVVDPWVDPIAVPADLRLPESEELLPVAEGNSALEQAGALVIGAQFSARIVPLPSSPVLYFPGEPRGAGARLGTPGTPQFFIGPNFTSTPPARTFAEDGLVAPRRPAPEPEQPPPGGMKRRRPHDGILPPDLVDPRGEIRRPVAVVPFMLQPDLQNRQLFPTETQDGLPACLAVAFVAAAVPNEQPSSRRDGRLPARPSFFAAGWDV